MSSRPPRTGQLSLLSLRDRLGERDLQILDHVGQLRLLTARQIETLFFPPDVHATAATASRRCRSVLERLTRERLLVRLERRIGGVRSGSASFVYALTSLGQRVLEQDRPRRRLAEPSERFVDHTLAVGEYELRWFIEIDRGSEHSPALRRKCRLYHTYYKGGHEQRRHNVFPRVLWVVPDKHRAERLRRLIEADPRLTADLFRITTPKRALTAIEAPE